jgi:hypothetical protein
VRAAFGWLASQPAFVSWFSPRRLYDVYWMQAARTEEFTKAVFQAAKHASEALVDRGAIAIPAWAWQSLPGVMARIGEPHSATMMDFGMKETDDGPAVALLTEQASLHAWYQVRILWVVRAVTERTHRAQEGREYLHGGRSVVDVSQTRTARRLFARGFAAVCLATLT